MHQTTPGWPAGPNSLRSTPVTRSLSSGTPQELMYSSSRLFVPPSIDLHSVYSSHRLYLARPHLVLSLNQLRHPSSNALQYRPQSVSHIESRKYAGIRIYRPSPCCTDSVDGSRYCGDSPFPGRRALSAIFVSGDLWIQDSGTPHNTVP